MNRRQRPSRAPRRCEPVGYSEAFWNAFKRGDLEVLATEELRTAQSLERARERRDPFYFSPHLDALGLILAQRRTLPTTLDHNLAAVEERGR